MAAPNRMAFKEQQKVKQIIDRAVERATTPNQPTRGTSSGGSFVSADLSFTTQPDEEGNTKIPALYDVDNWDESYWQ